MARHYVLGSWANADEYDYSGEQLMGHRQGKSICMDHMLPNGMANLKRYSDTAFAEPEQKPKANKKSLMYRVLPQQSTIDRLEAMKEELEREFDNGNRSLEEYSMLSIALDKKLDRAFKALERATSHSKGMTMLCGENAYNSGKSLLKQHIAIDYSIIPESSVLSQLSDGNIFKIFAVKLLTAKRNVAKMYTVVKQIVEEGLL